MANVEQTSSWKEDLVPLARYIFIGTPLLLLYSAAWVAAIVVAIDLSNGDGLDEIKKLIRE